MEPSDLIQVLRDRAQPLESASTTGDQVGIIKEFLEQREAVYLHRKSRPVWVPIPHRVTMTDKRDSAPSNYYGKLRNLWGASHINIQPIGVNNWKPAWVYYNSKVEKIPIPRPFRKGIYSIFLAELGHLFIKELQERILNQHVSVIPFEYKMIHKEAKKNKKKKILVKTGNYIESMKVSYGYRKVTLTVEHKRHEESDDITYLQLSRILEFGTGNSPAYSHWTRLKNYFDAGESKSFMKSFLHMYLDVPRNQL